MYTLVNISIHRYSNCYTLLESSFYLVSYPAPTARPLLEHGKLGYTTLSWTQSVSGNAFQKSPSANGTNALKEIAASSSFLCEVLKAQV